MKGGKIVKKNRIIKGILLLIVLALLTIGFTGCGGGIIPTTGTVYITIDTWDDYSLYVDGIYQAYVTNGYFTLTNVPAGYHKFEAYGYYYGYYGIVPNKYIYSGVTNYVTITTY